MFIHMQYAHCINNQKVVAMTQVNQPIKRLHIKANIFIW